MFVLFVGLCIGLGDTDVPSEGASTEAAFCTALRCSSIDNSISLSIIPCGAVSFSTHRKGG